MYDVKEGFYCLWPPIPVACRRRLYRRLCLFPWRRKISRPASDAGASSKLPFYRCLPSMPSIDAWLAALHCAVLHLSVPVCLHAVLRFTQPTPIRAALEENTKERNAVPFLSNEIDGGRGPSVGIVTGSHDTVTSQSGHESIRCEVLAYVEYKGQIARWSFQ